MYAYYVLDQGIVVVGFDNYPDKRVLRMKFGRKFSRHMHTRIPHKHGYVKQSLELTEEMTAEHFWGLLTKRALTLP